MVEVLADHEIDHVRMSVNSKNPLIILLNAIRIIRLARKYGVTIIHARSRAPAWSCYIATRLSGIKFITTFHGCYSTTIGVRYLDFIKKFYNSVMVRADRVIAVSDYIAEHIKSNYKILPNKLEVVDRWVDLTYFDIAKVDEKRALRLINQLNFYVKDLKTNINTSINTDISIKTSGVLVKSAAKAERVKDLANSMYNILLPARYTQWKGHLYVLEILKELPEDLSRNIRVAFVGKQDGKKGYLKEIQAKIKEYKLQDNIVVAESAPYMRELYAISDVVLVPSLRPEAFGRVVIESQVMGCVTVATDIGAPKYNIEHERNGFLIPSDDAKKAANILIKALQLKQYQLAEIKHNAITSAKYRFDKEKKCEQIIQIYNSLF